MESAGKWRPSFDKEGLTDAVIYEKWLQLLGQIEEMPVYKPQVLADFTADHVRSITGSAELRRP